MLTRERPKAATKRGRRTLLTGVVAVALLGGMTVSVAAAGVAGAATTRHIEVCKAGSVAGTFDFTVNGGAAFGLQTGGCKTVAATAETNTVTELADSTGATHLASISLVPNTGTTSVSTRTAKVTVAAGTTVTATFTNANSYAYLKVCKVVPAGSGLVGTDFNFTESVPGSTVGPFSVAAATTPDTSCGGKTQYQVGTHVNISEAPTNGVEVTGVSVSGGTLDTANYGAGTATATVGPSTTTTVVNYTNNNVPPPTEFGVVGVCKQPGDQYVTGSFNFQLSEPQNEWSSWISVATNGCTEVPNVPVGQVTITEADQPPYYLSSVAAIPQNDLVSVNLANQSAVFTVNNNAATTAFFTNSTEFGYVKVCKTLQDSNSDALIGSTFTFDVNDAAGMQTESVTAVAPGDATPCAFDFTALPVGSTATVTEVGEPNVAVTGVSVYPAGSGSVSGSTATLTVSATSVVSATFNNEALGWVEVCKTPADVSTANQVFPFTITSEYGQLLYSFTVKAGQCSQPYQVPAGTASVYEIQANPDFYLANVTAGTAGVPSINELESCSNCDPAIVGVQYGGVGNETLVTFTDAVVQGQFKICTQQTSPDANLNNGEPFVFTYSYTLPGATEPTTGTVTLYNPISGASCSAVSTDIPVVNGTGSMVDISVSEQQPSTASVELTNVLYQGNGTVISSPSVPTTTFPATLTFSNGAGMNVATFTQGRTP